MNSVDLSKTIAPKSDQLNADDLIAGPMTITVTQVRGVDGDQPIAVHFEGDSGKPYKPCKSMRRVLVHAWGKEGREYVGKRMTLYCDMEVAFGGVKVGGIRISHMSHIDRPLVIPLTVTRAKRTPFTVKPLRAEVHRAGQAPAGRRDHVDADLPPPPSDEPEADEGYTQGFGQTDADDDASEAVLWMRGVFENLQADPPVFRSTADLDAFFRDPDNGRNFEALKAEDDTLAKRLEAALKGRGKALASRH